MFNWFEFMFLSTYSTQTLLLAVFSLEFLICIKKFSEERLFTVITSGLLAAFYSLCTEIKKKNLCIWQTPSLPVCFFVPAVILLRIE